MGEEIETNSKLSGSKRGISRIVVAVLVLGGLGGGVYLANYFGFIDIPGIHQTINIPSKYEKVTVGLDTEFVTNEELAKIIDNITPPANQTDENGLQMLPQFTLLTPFILQDGDQIGMSNRYIGPGVDMATGKAVEPRYSPLIEFIVPKKGTEVITGIFDPKSVSVEVFKNPPWITNKEYFGGVKIRVTRQDGSKYQMSCYSQEDYRSLVPTSVLDNAPQADKDYQVWLTQKGLLVTGNNPIMKTNIDNAVISVLISRISSSRSTNDLFFSEIKLFQSSNGKILLPSEP